MHKEPCLPAVGFEAAVAQFEAWVRLLLLDGLQRLGFFRAPGEVRLHVLCHPCIKLFAS